MQIVHVLGDHGGRLARGDQPLNPVVALVRFGVGHGPLAGEVALPVLPAFVFAGNEVLKLDGSDLVPQAGARAAKVGNS